MGGVERPDMAQNIMRDGYFCCLCFIFSILFGILFTVSIGIMKRLGYKIIKTALCFLLVGGGIYWWKFSPVDAQTKQVTRMTLQQTVFGTGTLEAKTRVAISPYATGLVQTLHADQGDTVKSGELLVEMNAEDITQQLAVAEADLAIAKASIQRNEAEIAAARATLDYAKVTFERMDNLRQSNSVSQTDVDKSRQAYQVAVAHLEQAENKSSKLKPKLCAMKHKLSTFAPNWQKLN